MGENSKTPSTIEAQQAQAWHLPVLSFASTGRMSLNGRMPNGLPFCDILPISSIQENLFNLIYAGKGAMERMAFLEASLFAC